MPRTKKPKFWCIRCLGKKFQQDTCPKCGEKAVGIVKHPKGVPKFSFWNYRIMYILDSGGTKYYGIHEVHYTRKGRPIAWTRAMDPHSESIEGLAWCLKSMKQALKREPLHYYRETEGDSDQGGKYWGVKDD